MIARSALSSIAVTFLPLLVAGCGESSSSSSAPDLATAAPAVDAAVAGDPAVVAAIAGARVLTFNALLSTTLDATAGHRFFRIDAKAGDGVHIDAGGPQLDTVLSIYDAQGARLARNDNEYPDGSGPQACLLHRFKSDGAYYLDLTDIALQDDVTLTPTDPLDAQLSAQRFRPSQGFIGISHDAEKGDDQASAVQWVSPQLGANGFLFGSFRDAQDKDVFSVALGARESFAVFVMNGGIDGAGGTSEVVVRLADKDGNTLAESDSVSFDRQQVGPVRGINPVYLWVSRGPSTGANDSYAMKPVVF